MVAGTNLRRRMAAVVLGLLAGNLAFVAVVALLLSPWVAGVRQAVVATLPVDGVVAQSVWWACLLLPLLTLFLWAQLRYTRRQTLSEADAETVTRDAYPDLHARLDRLAQVAGCQAPTLAVAPSSVPNSFAVGTIDTATIVVSEGLLETLDDEELDAVLAHELAHIRNRDATVMTLASFLPALTNGEYRPLADLFGRWGHRVVLAGGALVAGLLLSTTVGRGTSGPGGLGSVLVLAGATYLLAGFALGVLTAPVAVLGRSLSQYREFAADEAGAAITGEPAALASALQQLDASAETSPETDKRRAYQGIQGLCFLPHGFGTDTERSQLYIETRTHPPTEERIDRFQAVAAE